MCSFIAGNPHAFIITYTWTVIEFTENVPVYSSNVNRSEVILAVSLYAAARSIRGLLIALIFLFLFLSFSRAEMSGKGDVPGLGWRELGRR